MLTLMRSSQHLQHNVAGWAAGQQWSLTCRSTNVIESQSMKSRTTLKQDGLNYVPVSSIASSLAPAWAVHEHLCHMTIHLLE